MYENLSELAAIVLVLAFVAYAVFCTADTGTPFDKDGDSE